MRARVRARVRARLGIKVGVRAGVRVSVDADIGVGQALYKARLARVSSGPAWDPVC